MPEYDLEGLLNEILDVSREAALKRFADDVGLRHSYPATVTRHPVRPLSSAASTTRTTAWPALKSAYMGSTPSRIVR